MADVTSPFAFPYPEDTDLVRDGATDIENLATGVNDYLAGGYLYAGTEYYTSSGTFAKADPLGTGDIGLRAIRVRMVGGGGGGGGAASTSSSQVAIGGAGGGGAYAEKFITDITGLSASETVTRGSGGAEGAAGNNNGSSGGQSSAFTVTADGGQFGGGGAAGSLTAVVFGNNGFGIGVTANADLSIPGSGSPIQQAWAYNRISRQRDGGGSFLSGQPTTTTAGSSYDGGAGVAGPGQGGIGGGCVENDATGRPGHEGQNGIVIIDCFV